MHCSRPRCGSVSRSFVIGDARVLAKALEVCGLTATLNRITGPEDWPTARRHRRAAPGHRRSRGAAHGRGPATRRRGRLCRDPHLDRPGDGRARRGVVTAPINKESLRRRRSRSSGIPRCSPNTPAPREEMTMFTISGLKIFFLTRHMSLAQACASITVPKVAKGIEQSIKALRQLGHRASRIWRWPR